MKTNKLPRSAWADPQAAGSQSQHISQSNTHYLSSDYIKKTGNASNDESYEHEVSNLLANYYAASNDYLIDNNKVDTLDTGNTEEKQPIDCGYKKAVKKPIVAAHKSDKEFQLLKVQDRSQQPMLEAEHHTQNTVETVLDWIFDDKGSDDKYANEKASDHNASNHKRSEIPERIFMNGLIKHTAIALAIIIPLAAFSAYAATPQVLPANTTPAAAVSNATPDKTTTATLSVKPSSIIHKSAPVPTTVDSVDLEQYAGTWYELGRLPMYFQRNCVRDVTATYTGKTDGSGIIVSNKCTGADGKAINAEGIAKPADNSGSKLKVTFLPSWIRWLPVGRADYWVLARDADYKTALVGTPDKKYLWLLARSPNITQETYGKYREIAQQQGYDLKEFKLTTQSNQTVNLVP